MHITASELRQKQFEKKAFGGVDRDEVIAYLATVAGELERSLEERNELRDRLARAESEVGKLREIESSLYKTLKTAEETGAQMVEQARKTSQIQIREAELRAESLLKEARWQARNLIDDARQQAKRTYQVLQEETLRLEQDYRQLERYRENLLAELKMLATDINEKADRELARARAGEFRRPELAAIPQEFTINPEFEASLEGGSGDMGGSSDYSSTHSLPAASSSDRQEGGQESGGSGRSFFDQI